MWLNKQRKEKHTNKAWRTIVPLFFKQKLRESLGSWKQNKKWWLKTFTQFVYVWHLVPVASWFEAILLLLVSEETNFNLHQKIVKKHQKHLSVNWISMLCQRVNEELKMLFANCKAKVMTLDPIEMFWKGLKWAVNVRKTKNIPKAQEFQEANVLDWSIVKSLVVVIAES